MATEATTPDGMLVDEAAAAVTAHRRRHEAPAEPIVAPESVLVAEAAPAVAIPRRRILPPVHLGLPAIHWRRILFGLLIFVRDWSALPLVALLALGAALTYVRAAAFLMPIFDDSFISLNFARNFADTGMLSFDGEKWSMGATSPLHVVLLGAVLKAGAAPIFATIAFGVAMHMLLASSVWMFGLAIFRSRVVAHLAAVAMAFTPFALLDTVNGMETGLFMAVISLTCAAYFFHRTRWGLFVTSFFLALTILTRPEGVFLLPALLVYHFIAQPKGRKLIEYLKDADIIWTLPLIALGALAAYSYGVTGTFSGTATVKMQFFREFVLPLETKVTLGGDQLGLFYGPMLGMVALAIIGAAQRRESLLPALFWVPVIVLYVLLFPGSLFHYFYRYQHPILPFIAVFAAAGAYRVLLAAAVGNWVTKALVMVGLVVAIVPVTQQYERWRVISAQAVIETRTDMVGMARSLDSLILPSQTLAAHDVGAVGYYGRFKVLDLVGLINPEAVDYHGERRLKAFIEKERPDFLLFFPEWDRSYLLIDPWYRPHQYHWVGGYSGGHLRKSTYFLYRVTYPQYTVLPEPSTSTPLLTAAVAPPPGSTSQPAAPNNAPSVAPVPSTGLTLAIPSKISPPRTGDAGLRGIETAGRARVPQRAVAAG